MKKRMLNELNLNQNICYNKISQTDKEIRITKSNIRVGSIIEIREICDIYMILEKYKSDFDIVVSTQEVLIQFK
ncbi:MAG: hypothetical protein HRT41_06220 [Campylobacteraceae bacterium]|nr:hypothetical protein [Campylobacteraceae bacterium]